MEWYYADESDQQIAFQEEDFKSLIEVGTIKPDTLVWNSTMTDWKAASITQPALFGMPAAPANVATAPPNYYGGPPRATDGLALASMICGIFAILMTCAYGIGAFPGIAAIICGHMSRKKVANGGPADGAGMATAGLIMGYIGTIVGILFVGGIILAIVLASMAEGTAG